MDFKLENGKVFSFNGKLNDKTVIKALGGIRTMTYGQMLKFMPDEAIELLGKSNV